MATATQLRWLLTPDDASIAGKPPVQGWTPCEVGRRPSSRTGVLSVGRFTPPDGKFDNSAPRRTSPEASICTDMRVARWSPPTPSRHCLAARRPEAARHGVRPRQRLNSHPLAPGRVGCAFHRDDEATIIERWLLRRIYASRPRRRRSSAPSSASPSPSRSRSPRSAGPVTMQREAAHERGRSREAW